MTLSSENLRKAHDALQNGRITQTEYDYLTGTDTHTEKKNSRIRIGIAAFFIMALMGVALFTNGGITGLVTAEWNETTFTNNTIIDLKVTGITSLKISGEHTSGSATITTIVGNETYVVYSGTINDPRIWTEKILYGLEETVTVIVNMTNYTLWIDDGNKTPVENNFTINETGTYTIEALGEEKLSIEIIIQENKANTTRPAPITILTNACSESCILPASNETIQLRIETNGEISIADIHLSTGNTAPEQIAELPSVTITDNTTINLSNYFTDPDGDYLSYEMNNLLGIAENINGDILTLEGNLPGTYLGIIYVSDLQAITTAEFTITVEEVVDESINKTNQTEPGPGNETQKLNETNNKNTSQFDCDHLNINKRPPECFGTDLNVAYKEVIAPLYNKKQNKVGRITRFGNLIIKGDLITNSNGTPNKNDFSVGYVQTTEIDQIYMPTAWIDTKSGDLHVQGKVYEEIIDLDAPAQNTYIINNRNGIILGYFDRITGDLYLRGNLVKNKEP